MALPPEELDVEAVERALSGPLRTALYEARRLCGVEAADRWHLHPRLGPFFVDIALLRLVRIAERRGASFSAAVDEACEKLGLQPSSTVRSRLVRHRREYLENGHEYRRRTEAEGRAEAA
jgi:hypothetical protein